MTQVQTVGWGGGAGPGREAQKCQECARFKVSGMSPDGFQPGATYAVAWAACFSA